MKESKRQDPRVYMKIAIEEMQKSIQEPRTDHPSPKVGAVLVFPDGTYDTSFRGEIRHGEHAEFILLDKKYRNKDLTGFWLFATLEPCSPGSRNAPKVPCSERIVNARISDVWFGEEDLALADDRGGINYLSENGINVHPFDIDLHNEIKRLNKEFDDWALQQKYKKLKGQSVGYLYELTANTDIDSLSKVALQKFIDSCKLNVGVKSQEFYRELLESDILRSGPKKSLIPTGNGILLFGKNPRNKFDQSSVKAKVDYGNGDTDVESFDDALVLIPDKVEAWVRKVIPESFDRSTFTREKVPYFPPEVVREAIINAIVHRDYEIDGAKVQLEIKPDRITIKSPGLPVPPNTIEMIKDFTAISYSRNKKIALFFNRMKLMEEVGIGMDTYREMRTKYKLPLPLISYIKPNLIVTFPRTADAVRDISKSEAISKLNDEELAGFDFVKSRGEVSRKEYEVNFGYNPRKANRHLNKLMELGLIIDNGNKPTSPNYRYVYNG